MTSLAPVPETTEDDVDVPEVYIEGEALEIGSAITVQVSLL